MGNGEKWRCTCGRQLYKTKFEKTQITLSVNGELDENYAEMIFRGSLYWEFLESVMKKNHTEKGVAI
jgi:hypothetical protein